MTKAQNNLPPEAEDDDDAISHTITDHLAIGGSGNSLQDLVVGRTSMAAGSFEKKAAK